MTRIAGSRDSSSSDGASSSSTAVFAVAGIAIVAVIAGLVFFFVRKSDDGTDVNKDWNSENFAYRLVERCPLCQIWQLNPP